MPQPSREQKPITGYFTIERNLEGLSTLDMERRLGFPTGRMAAGAKVWLLSRHPDLGQFESWGSTLTPDGDGLNRAVMLRCGIPGAWYGQRLVKVEPVIRHVDGDEYPRATGMPVEQWRLTVEILAHLACVLQPGARYWKAATSALPR
ncbi:MAG: hypothetical protein AB7O97_15160 [Planctomycetota bacterium]